MAALNKDTVKEIVSLGRSATAVQYVAGMPFAVVPQGHTLEDLSPFLFSEHNKEPERIKATVTVRDTASFIQYWQQFVISGSQAFADETANKITAIFDYHEPGVGGDDDPSPRWCQHRAILALRPSIEWTTWITANNRRFTQLDFAEFLEQNAIDISSPDPAGMLEVARDLEAHTEVEFASGSRANNGQVRLRYTETTKATVGGGAMAVPEQFALHIPVFVGGPPVVVNALLRYRIKEGKLVLWYTLLRPDDAMRLAFTQCRELIESGLKIAVLNGTP